MKRWLRICTLLLLIVHNEVWAGGEMPPKPITEEEVKKLILDAMEPSTFEMLWRWKCSIAGGVACAIVGFLLFKRNQRVKNRINQELENTENLKKMVTGKVDAINNNLTEQTNTVKTIKTTITTLSSEMNTQLSTIQDNLTAVQKQQLEIPKKINDKITEHKEQFTKSMNDNNNAIANQSGAVIATIKNLNSADDKSNEELTKKLHIRFGDFTKKSEDIEKIVKANAQSIMSDTAAIESKKNVTAQEITSVTTNIELLGQSIEKIDLSDSKKRIGTVQQQLDTIYKSTKERESQIQKLGGLLENRNTRQQQKTASNRARSASPTMRMPHYSNNNNNVSFIEGSKTSLSKNSSINSNTTNFSRRSYIGYWDDNNNNNNYLRSSKEDNNNNNNLRSSKDEKQK
jgi:hypothetical protein